MHFTSTLAGLLLLASSSVAVPRPQSSDTAQVQPPPNKFKILRLYAPANGPTTDKSEQFEIDLRRWEDPDDKKLHCKGSVKYPRKADEAAGGYGEYLNGCDKGLDVAIYFPNGGAAAVNGFQVQIKLLSEDQLNYTQSYQPFEGPLKEKNVNWREPNSDGNPTPFFVIHDVDVA